MIISMLLFFNHVGVFCMVNYKLLKRKRRPRPKEILSAKYSEFQLVFNKYYI